MIWPNLNLFGAVWIGQIALEIANLLPNFEVCVRARRAKEKTQSTLETHTDRRNLLDSLNSGWPRMWRVCGRFTSTVRPICGCTFGDLHRTTHEALAGDRLDQLKMPANLKNQHLKSAVIEGSSDRRQKCSASRVHFVWRWGRQIRLLWTAGRWTKCWSISFCGQERGDIRLAFYL